MHSSNAFALLMASRMYLKFEKYRAEYSRIVAIAVILNPRNKVQFVEFCYNMLYGSGSVEGNQDLEKLNSLFSFYMNDYLQSGT